MTEADVLGALERVRDPELDRPITELGFVAELNVEGDAVEVVLHLPTYFCAPNFAYLMVAKAREAVLAVAGVRAARVTLGDHFASDRVNPAVAGGHGFEGAFPGEAGGGLDELERIFAGKGFVARQERICQTLLGEGRSLDELARMRLRDLPVSDEVERYLERRAELGLDVSPEAQFLVNPNGEPFPPEAVARHLRLAHTVRVSMEGNADFCRGLLATRYGERSPEEEDR